MFLKRTKIQKFACTLLQTSGDTGGTAASARVTATRRHANTRAAVPRFAIASFLLVME